ncbi:hypothetical protein EDB81DRAFT_387231 [Dactylonectria macrodidyma]|uniref:Uncharacterized protein n=1 Tax=Dactylonectria macrodidyma TaxID=307937 RepID=A0A9P9F7V7_9HYPO|nr:hypothetical protein EDB81DRAFT_387231 [Dactylonectria macrodidyma]
MTAEPPQSLPDRRTGTACTVDSPVSVSRSLSPFVRSTTYCNVPDRQIVRSDYMIITLLALHALHRGLAGSNCLPSIHPLFLGVTKGASKQGAVGWVARAFRQQSGMDPCSGTCNSACMQHYSALKAAAPCLNAWTHSRQHARKETQGNEMPCLTSRHIQSSTQRRCGSSQEGLFKGRRGYPGQVSLWDQRVAILAPRTAVQRLRLDMTLTELILRSEPAGSMGLL